MLFIVYSCDHQVQHYQIQRNDRDWVTADGEEYFENLVKLVEVTTTTTTTSVIV